MREGDHQRQQDGVHELVLAVEHDKQQQRTGDVETDHIEQEKENQAGEKHREDVEQLGFSGKAAAH